MCSSDGHNFLDVFSFSVASPNKLGFLIISFPNILIGNSLTDSLIGYRQDKISPLLLVCVLSMDFINVFYLDHMLLLVLSVTIGLTFADSVNFNFFVTFSFPYEYKCL